VAPSGPREQLVLQAKEKYRLFQSAASSFSSQAASAANTVIHGDSKHQASMSLASAAAQVTNFVVGQFDDAKDYVYSTWDDSQLENYLKEKGLITEKSEKTRDQLLVMMRDAYAKVADPIWEVWSDSYMVCQPARYISGYF